MEPESWVRVEKQWVVQLSKTVANVGAEVQDPMVLFTFWACRCTPDIVRGRILLNFVPLDGVPNKPVHFSIFAAKSRRTDVPVHVWRGSPLSISEFTDEDFREAGGDPDAPWLGAEWYMSVARYAVNKGIEKGVIPKLDPPSHRRFQTLLAMATGRKNLLMPDLLEEIKHSHGRGGLGFKFKDARSEAIKSFKIRRRVEKDRNFRVKDDLCLNVAKEHMESPCFDIALLLHAGNVYSRYEEYKASHKATLSRKVWGIVDRTAKAWSTHPDVLAAKSMTLPETLSCVWDRIAQWLPDLDLGPRPLSMDDIWGGDVAYKSKYHPDLAGRPMVSVDLKTANFVALSALGTLFDNVTSWSEFFGRALDELEEEEPEPAIGAEARSLYAKGKKLRLVLLGKVLPRWVRVAEATLIYALAQSVGAHHDILSLIEGPPLITSSDEFLLVPRSASDAAALVEAITSLLSTPRFEPKLVHVDAYELCLQDMSEQMIDTLDAVQQQEQDEVVVESTATFKTEIDEELQPAYDDALSSTPLPELESEARDLRGTQFCILRGIGEGKGNKWIKFKHVPRLVRALAILSVVDNDVSALFPDLSEEELQAFARSFKHVTHQSAPSSRNDQALHQAINA